MEQKQVPAVSFDGLALLREAAAKGQEAVEVRGQTSGRVFMTQAFFEDFSDVCKREGLDVRLHQATQSIPVGGREISSASFDLATGEPLTGLPYVRCVSATNNDTLRFSGRGVGPVYPFETLAAKVAALRAGVQLMLTTDAGTRFTVDALGRYTPPTGAEAIRAEVVGDPGSVRVLMTRESERDARKVRPTLPKAKNGAQAGYCFEVEPRSRAGERLFAVAGPWFPQNPYAFAFTGTEVPDFEGLCLAVKAYRSQARWYEVEGLLPSGKRSGWRFRALPHYATCEGPKFDGARVDREAASAGFVAWEVRDPEAKLRATFVDAATARTLQPRIRIRNGNPVEARTNRLNPREFGSGDGFGVYAHRRVDLLLEDVALLLAEAEAETKPVALALTGARSDGFVTPERPFKFHRAHLSGEVNSYAKEPPTWEAYHAATPFSYRIVSTKAFYDDAKAADCHLCLTSPLGLGPVAGAGVTIRGKKVVPCAGVAGSPYEYVFTSGETFSAIVKAVAEFREKRAAAVKAEAAARAPKVIVRGYQ